MANEFKDKSSTIEDGVTKDDAKQACTLCLNQFKKNMLTPFDLNKDQREYPLCITCLSKIKGTNKNSQGSSPAMNYEVTLSRYAGNASLCSKQCIDSLHVICVLFLLLSLVGFIIVGARYVPTLKWKSIEGTINTSSPCVVEYEIDGQLYKYTTKFDCEELGPYRLIYNPQDPDDAVSAAWQDANKIGLIVFGCLIFGITYIMIVTCMCRRFDFVPMLKRKFRRS